MVKILLLLLARHGIFNLITLISFYSNNLHDLFDSMINLQILKSITKASLI
jgi:hypothetical protein